MEIKGEHSVIRDCSIGEGTVVWSFCNLYGCSIGKDCRIGSYVEIGKDVTIGDRCKVQSFAYIPQGVTIGDEVFIGPRATFTNHRTPSVKKDWEISETIVEDGVTIGAGAVIICGIRIGKGSMVGAGAVVTKDVNDGETVVGNPARPIKRK